MNLSPIWVDVLIEAGHDAVHWSKIGRADALDDEILGWAGEHDHVILTSDLDFGTLLMTSGALKPSVVQLRSGSTLPSRMGSLLTRVLDQTNSELVSGALVTVENDRVRLRPLSFAEKA